MILNTIASRHKLSQSFRIAVLVLAIISLIAEVLPEVEAKSIVIPALILAVILSLVEFQKNRSAQALA